MHSMNPDIRNRNNIIKEKSKNTYNTNNMNTTTETEHFNEKTYNSQNDGINEKKGFHKQEEFQQQKDEENQPSATNQFTLDRPVTVSDVLEGKITLPTPIKKTNKRKCIQRNFLLN